MKQISPGPIESIHVQTCQLFNIEVLYGDELLSVSNANPINLHTLT